MTARWARPGPGPGRQRVAALGGGPPVVAVVAVVHAGPHVHPETSLGLLFDLQEERVVILARRKETLQYSTEVSLKQLRRVTSSPVTVQTYLPPS